MGNPHARVDFNPTSMLNSRKRTENFGLGCGSDEQGGGGLKLKQLKLKGDVLYRPGPAELGHNIWNLPFRHIYYDCPDLFSIVLYMVPTVKHMHGMGHLTRSCLTLYGKIHNSNRKKNFFREPSCRRVLVARNIFAGAFYLS